MSNPKNHVGWPEVVRKDVKKQVYDLRSLIWQVREAFIIQRIEKLILSFSNIFARFVTIIIHIQWNPVYSNFLNPYLWFIQIIKHNSNLKNMKKM